MRQLFLINMLMFIHNGKLNISLIDVGSEAIFDTDVNIDKNHDFTIIFCQKGCLSGVNRKWSMYIYIVQ